MGRKKKYHPFDWIPYLFKGEIPQHPEDEPAGEEDTSGKESGGKKKKRRKGIDDENPVSFRTVNGPLTWQQKFYFVVRDLSYACGPMFGYIITALVCIIVGYPLTGMLRMGFEDYLKTYSNSMIALGVLITLRRMFRKSKKNAIIGCICGTVIMTVFGTWFNAVYLLPTFSRLFHMDMDVILGMGQAINPGVKDLTTFVILMVAPLNIVKGVVVSVITMLIYKPLSPIIKYGSRGGR